jgi:TolB-like protein
MILALIFPFVLSLPAQEAEIKSVADALSGSLSNASRPRVAVVDFTDLQGTVTPLGRYMAEELETALANTGGSFDLIDRTRLQLLMQENKLASTGVIDPSTARQLGKIAGVHILITGTLVPMSDTVRMTIKALDTEDAHIVSAVSRNLLMTRALMQLAGQVSSVTQAPGYPPTDNASAGIPTAPPAAQTSRPMVAKGQQVSFELKSCIYSGSSVTCNLAITNEADDRNLVIYMDERTRTFDDQGRETSVSEAMLGSHKREGCCTGLVSTMISGLSTHAQLIFGKAASDISFISKLEIVGNVEGKDFSVSFKKVPLSDRR